MLIDWFTVSAQVVNFLILVWLLKHLLYQPVLKAIDARETTLAKKLATAESKMAEATQLVSEFKQKQQEFDQQRATLLSQAIDQAQTERLRILEEARQTAATLSIKRQVALQYTLLSLNQLIRNKTQQQVFAIARKVLQELADTRLEQSATAVFLQRLQGINLLPAVTSTFNQAKIPVRVKSAFELAEPERMAIREAFKQNFPAAQQQILFETAPEQISGIELSSNGYKLVWSIADYLTTLEKSVAEMTVSRHAN